MAQYKFYVIMRPKLVRNKEYTHNIINTTASLLENY